MRKIFKLRMTCSTTTRRCASSRLLCFCKVGQLRLARLLLRRPALFMELLQALIEAVAEHFEALMRLDLAPPGEGKVMDGVASMRRADHLSGRAVDYDLTFQRVPTTSLPL